MELLAPPQEKAPKFLKASASDKALVQQETKKSKGTQISQTLTKSLGATNKTMAFGEGKPSSPVPLKALKSKPRLKNSGN